MNIHYLKHTTAASLTAMALCLASVSTSFGQAPSYPIGQGPFGQPQVQQQPAAQPQQQYPAQQQPPGQNRAPGQYGTPPGKARGWGQQRQWGQPQAAAMSGAAVQLASPEANNFSLESLAGKPVRGAGQVELGVLTDFLIDPQSGAVRYALVPTGSGVSGQTYRVIPIGALDPTSGPQGLRTHISRAQWDQVGTFAEDRVRGNIALNQEEQQRIEQQFGLNQSSAQNASNNLVRVSELRGKTLQSNGQQLGIVQDVAVDVRHQLAAVMMTTGAVAGQGQKFLVPFEQLQIGSPEQASINTTLTQYHLQQAQSGMPTGMTSPFSSANAPAAAAAMEVRRALDQDQSVARANVQVIPESRIALRGIVQSEQIRSNIERIAKEAAPGLQVDNHITVQP